MGRFHPAAVVPPLGEFTAMGPLVWLGEMEAVAMSAITVFEPLLWPMLGCG